MWTPVMWTPVTCPVIHYVLVMLYGCRTPIKQTHTLSDVCAGEQGCTSAEPLTSLSGSCHVPAVCNTVKTQGIVLASRIVSQLLSSIWPQSEQLNETLLPLEQWGVKSLASMACVRMSIVLLSDMFCLKLFMFWPLKPKLWFQSQPDMTSMYQKLFLSIFCSVYVYQSFYMPPFTPTAYLRVTRQIAFGRCSCSK